MKYILVVCAVVVSGVLFAQEDKPKSRFVDVQILSGSSFSSYASNTLGDFQSLAPQSSILFSDLSEYETSMYSQLSGSNGFTMLLGLQLNDNKNQQLRIGLGYSNRSLANLSMGRWKTYAYDTLTSSQTGQEYYVDSVSTSGVYGSSSAEFISLEGSYIFRTNHEARWSLYGGFGVGFGVGVNRTVNLYQYQYSYFEGPVNNEEGTTGENEVEMFRLGSAMNGQINFPMGVDFRIGKKREFWQRIHLMYELKPGMVFTSTPELGSTFGMFLSSNMGLRVTF